MVPIYCVLSFDPSHYINTFPRFNAAIDLPRSTQTMFPFILLFIATLVTSSPTQEKCPENEVWDPCGQCEPYCDNPFPTCTEVCNPGKCVCQRGFLRSAHGNCIESSGCQWENNPCTLAECATGHVCRIEAVVCKKAPCAKQAVCVKQDCFKQ